MDNLTPEQRRKNMQNIRSEGSKAERLIMDALTKEGLSFSCYDKNILGKPDIVFHKESVLVFVDSDFWHGHPERFILPKTNVSYWKDKIEKNKTRDRRITRRLRKDGWSVLRVWEYDVNHNLDKCLRKIIGKLVARRKTNH